MSRDKQTVYERAIELAQSKGYVGIVEFIRAQRDDAGARFKAVPAFTENRLFNKSYSDLKTMHTLSPEQRWDVYSNAIEMAIQDAITQTPRP